MAKLTRLSLLLGLAVALPAAPALARISTEYIRNVIRAHLTEIRSCYEDGLRTRPDLAGRVVMRFTIGADGTVSSAEVASTTLHDPPVEACIAERVRHFQFPPIPGGGTVSVNYPFVFEAPDPGN